jgi:hypothetical protein
MRVVTGLSDWLEKERISCSKEECSSYGIGPSLLNSTDCLPMENIGTATICGLWPMSFSTLMKSQAVIVIAKSGGRDWK